MTALSSPLQILRFILRRTHIHSPPFQFISQECYYLQTRYNHNQRLGLIVICQKGLEGNTAQRAKPSALSFQLAVEHPILDSICHTFVSSISRCTEFWRKKIYNTDVLSVKYTALKQRSVSGTDTHTHTPLSVR
jgi:ssRNA-specific RNase YbeY (16S rRNA maturation enzyme)